LHLCLRVIVYYRVYSVLTAAASLADPPTVLTIQFHILSANKPTVSRSPTENNNHPNLFTPSLLLFGVKASPAMFPTKTFRLLSHVPVSIPKSSQSRSMSTFPDSQTLSPLSAISVALYLFTLVAPPTQEPILNLELELDPLEVVSEDPGSVRANSRHFTHSDIPLIQAGRGIVF